VSKVHGVYTAHFLPENHAVEIDGIEPGILDSNIQFGSIVMQAIAENLPPPERYDDSIWDKVLQPEYVRKVLNTRVKEHALDIYKEMSAASLPSERRRDTNIPEKAVRSIIEHESGVAGVLLQLKKDKGYEPLKNLFFSRRNTNVVDMAKYAIFQDPFERINPKKDLERVGLSPIGIAHLFRQYFFEFDTFLGPPVGHIWLSPGTTVELLEVSTRKTTVERTRILAEKDISAWE